MSEHTPPPLARPGASARDAEAVWAVITGMYEAYREGNRAAIDARLDPRTTIWDSAADPLLLGRPDLERLRAERPAAGDGPVESGLAPGPDGRPARPELVRNTAVLRRDAGGGRLIVHLHEDVRHPGGVPGAGG